MKHHGHVTGKYQGFAHQGCNLNLSLNKKVVALFYNLQNYGSHLDFQGVRKCNFKIHVIPKIEKNT